MNRPLLSLLSFTAIIIMIPLTLLSACESTPAGELDSNIQNTGYEESNYRVVDTELFIASEESNIHLPEFQGMDESKKEERLNDEITSSLDESLRDNGILLAASESTIEHNFNITYHDEHFVSIVNEVFYSATGAAHPFSFCYLVNLNLDRAEVIDNAFYELDYSKIPELLLSGKLKLLDSPLIDDEQEQFLDSLFDEGEEYIIQSYSSEETAIYFSDRGFNFVVPTAHALGDYYISEITYGEAEASGLSSFSPNERMEQGFISTRPILMDLLQEW